MSSLAALPAATLRHAKMTLHFALASALTVSTPMPLLPPVTMATLPERSGLIVAMTSAAVDFLPSAFGALTTRPREPRSQANITTTRIRIDCTRIAAQSLAVADWRCLALKLPRVLLPSH